MLPSAHDICPIPEDLDGQVALQNYLGKTVADAEKQIGENSLYYIGDFMWMGLAAFRFYLPAINAYFANAKSDGDSSAVDSIIGILEQRLTWEREDTLQARDQIVPLLDVLIERYPAFEVAEEIFGDLRAKAIALRKTFSGENNS